MHLRPERLRAHAAEAAAMADALAGLGPPVEAAGPVDAGPVDAAVTRALRELAAVEAALRGAAAAAEAADRRAADALRRVWVGS
jgi:hypothetical protein